MTDVRLLLLSDTVGVIDDAEFRELVERLDGWAAGASAPSNEGPISVVLKDGRTVQIVMSSNDLDEMSVVHGGTGAFDYIVGELKALATSVPYLVYGPYYLLVPSAGPTLESTPAGVSEPSRGLYRIGNGRTTTQRVANASRAEAVQAAKRTYPARWQVAVARDDRWVVVEEGASPTRAMPPVLYEVAHPLGFKITRLPVGYAAEHWWFHFVASNIEAAEVTLDPGNSLYSLAHSSISVVRDGGPAYRPSSGLHYGNEVVNLLYPVPVEEIAGEITVAYRHDDIDLAREIVQLPQ